MLLTHYTINFEVSSPLHLTLSYYCAFLKKQSRQSLYPLNTLIYQPHPHPHPHSCPYPHFLPRPILSCPILSCPVLFLQFVSLSVSRDRARWTSLFHTWVWDLERELYVTRSCWDRKAITRGELLQNCLLRWYFEILKHEKECQLSVFWLLWKWCIFLFEKWSSLWISK